MPATPAPPRISIIIPTFNRADMLAEALASALAQTYGHLEIIVSDNASTDATAATIARFDPARFRYHRNAENLGMVGNWRQAIGDLATGDFFLLLSDDDSLLDPDYVAKAARLIQEHPGIVLVYGEGYVLDTRSGLRTELRLPFAEVEPGSRVFAARGKVRPQDFTLCNVLFHRRLALELDAFSDPLDLTCDSELFLNLCQLGQVGIVKGMASVYRQHGSNLIDTVRADPELLAHSTRMLINPYHLALEKGCPAPEEAAFAKLARRELMYSLLTMYEHHPGSYKGFVADLRVSAPDLLHRVQFWHRFQRKLGLLRLRRGLAWLLRGATGLLAAATLGSFIN